MKTRVLFHFLYCLVFSTTGVLSVSATPINDPYTSALLSTVPGEQYTLSFNLEVWLHGGGRDNTVQFIPSFGSESLGPITFSDVGGNQDNMVSEQFNCTVTATTDLTTLTFLNSGEHHDHVRWAIDDVVLTPASPTSLEESTPNLPAEAIPGYGNSSVEAIAGLFLGAFGVYHKRLKA